MVPGSCALLRWPPCLQQGHLLLVLVLVLLLVLVLAIIRMGVEVIIHSSEKYKLTADWLEEHEEELDARREALKV